MPPPAPGRSGVGAYLIVVQFLFALTWVAYVIYLPSLAAQVGLPRQAVVWILMLDQLVFIAADLFAGVASDRAAAVVGRLGRTVLAVTLLSCAAFVALPFVAPGGSAPMFLALTLLWSVSSSALRVAPLALIGRHVPRPAQGWMLALAMLGLGLANAAAPYLGLLLRGVDARLPFVISATALAAATLGIVAAERLLAGAAVPAPTAPAPPPIRPTTLPLFVAAALLAALAFQLHSFVNSAALYQRHAGADRLPYLAPLFWVGFNLCLWPAGLAGRRWGTLRVMAVAGALAGLAAVAAPLAPDLAVLASLQCLAGAAWAALLVNAFAAALQLGHAGREGRFGGALSALLALAALVRLAVVAGGAPQAATAAALLPWLPVAGWLLAGLLAWRLGRHLAQAPGGA